MPPGPVVCDIEVVDASLSDTHALSQALAEVDVVVHSAAQIVIGSTPVEEFFDVNVGGTLRLIEAAATQPTPIRRFVLISTDNVYRPGAARAMPITEQQVLVPGDYYGTSKVLAEEVVKNYHQLHGLEYTILRLGSVITPNEAVELFRRNWTRAFLSAHARAGRRSSLWPLFSGRDDLSHLVDEATAGRGDNPAVVLTGPDDEPWAIHLTDVRDAVAGILLGIDHRHAANDAFNIVGPRTTNAAEAAAHLGRHLGIDAVTVRLPVGLTFEVSIAKARRALGYRPTRDFEASLTTAISGAKQTVVDYVPAGEA